MPEFNGSTTNKYSETDSSCTAPCPDGAPSGMFPNQAEGVWRALMGACQRWFDRSNGTVTTTGTSPHYVYTPVNTSFPTALANGEVFSWKADKDSASGADLNINSLGAKPLYKITSSGPAAIAAGDIKASARVITQYDSALNGGSGAHLVIAGLVATSSTTSPGGSSGQLQYNNSGSFGGVPAVNGDGTLNTGTGALVVTKTNGSNFAASATTDTTNASNISSGTVPAARLPLGSSSAFGAVKVDGTTITASAGVISATGAVVTPLGVGSIVFATTGVGASSISAGATIAGSSLTASYLASSPTIGTGPTGDTLTGTWQALQSLPAPTGGDSVFGWFQRIS